jgi:hypothetical protein
MEIKELDSFSFRESILKVDIVLWKMSKYNTNNDDENSIHSLF